MKWYQNPNMIKSVVNWVIENIEFVLLRGAPILAPLPSAFALAHAVEKTGMPAAAFLGFIIEGLGIVAGVVMAWVSLFNHRFPGRAIDQRLTYGLFAFYVVIAAMFIGGLETLPAWVDWSYGFITSADFVRSFVPLLFPGLTLIGAVVIALRDYMERVEGEAAHQIERVEAAQDAKQQKVDAEFNLDLEFKRREREQELEFKRREAEQKLEIERQKAEVRLSKAVSKAVKMDTANGVQKKGTIDDMIAIYRSKPDASLREVGDQIGRSQQTVSNWLDRLEMDNRIHRNGGGVEVKE